MLRNHGFDVTINHYELNGTPPEGILISPLRDPWLNYVSHISKNRSYQLFKEAWIRFNEVYESGREMFLLPVDHKDRDKYLSKLSDHLGVELKTNWKPRGSGVRIKPDDIDLDEIYNLPVVKQFYTYRERDYTEGMTMASEDPIIRRIEMGLPKETIKEVFGLNDAEYDKYYTEALGPIKTEKKRGRPKKIKS